MLSTISSFLPSLSLSHDKDKPATPAADPPDPVASQQDDAGQKRKAKPPPLNETFIVVRPPPAMSNHPLNLQLQLVPPAAARATSTSSNASTTRLSIDSVRSVAEPGQVDAGRTTAVAPAIASGPANSGQSAPPSPTAERSADASVSLAPQRSVTDISLYTTNSSSSLASVSTNASSGSAIRRIVPLYNLHAHNVMQNTVLDAGTDVKVARFQKRGLEIVDLCFLELFEVWGTPGVGGGDIPKSVQKRTSFFSANPFSPEAQDPNGDAKMSKRASIASFQSSSITSVHSGNGLTDVSSLPLAKTPTLNDSLNPDDTPKRGAKKFFGRMFKKKEPSTPDSARFGMHSAGLRPGGTPLTPASSRGSTYDPPASAFAFDDASTPTQTPGLKTGMPTTAALLAQPTLDLQATLVKSNPLAHRPSSYVWIVKKWLKRSRIDSLKGLMTAASDQVSKLNITKLGGPGGTAHDPFEKVELRFEWVRSTKARVKRGRVKEVGASDDKERTRAISTASRTSTRRGSEAPDNEQGKLLGTSLKGADPSASESHSNRSSPDRESTTTAENDQNPRLSVVAADEDEESDPEDSETPWNCTLVLHRLYPEQSHILPSIHLPHFPSIHSPSSRTSVSQDATPTTGKGHSRGMSTPTANALSTPTQLGAGTAGHAQSASEQGTAASTVLSDSPVPLSEEPTSLPPPDPPTKLKIATLHPSPHHPKIVAQLKVPFPLPDVDLNSCVVHRRKKTRTEEDRRPHRENDHILSAEEIKDVICSTALWLVVREAFGGVGKDKRRGDGWRIRA